MARLLTVLIVTTLSAVLWVAPAVAADGPAPQPLLVSEPSDVPESFELDAREAAEIAGGDANVVRHARANDEPLRATVTVNRDKTWLVLYRNAGVAVVQVEVDPESGKRLESWTGDQITWRMARGYEGQFGHVLNAAWVWIPLALVFLLGLFDFSRALRIAHLDLLVLLSFGLSLAFFNAGEIGLSVPLAYPPLVYLLLRMLWIGARGAGLPRLRPSLPVGWLIQATVALIVFRLVLNIADSGVIDVGYAGVIGADMITSGETLYGNFPSDNHKGDTYGFANYLLYTPFELILPWSGSWDGLPAAHFASLFYDLLTVFGLFVLGRRLAGCRASLRSLQGWNDPGNRLGYILAFAWVAYPFTTYALQSNSNDMLVSAGLVWALVLFASPAGRGAVVALTSMVKFATLALAPLFAVGDRGLADRIEGFNPRGWRLGSVLIFVASFALVTALLLVWPFLDPGPKVFFENTLVNQLDRTSPFSIWGQTDLDGLQKAVQLGTILLALTLAFVPRRRNLAQTAALAAAILIAGQIALDHWFYLYIPWFFALVMVALAAPATLPRRDPEPDA